jgi:hypothetical protein
MRVLWRFARVMSEVRHWLGLGGYGIGIDMEGYGRRFGRVLVVLVGNHVYTTAIFKISMHGSGFLLWPVGEAAMP